MGNKKKKRNQNRRKSQGDNNNHHPKVTAPHQLTREEKMERRQVLSQQMSERGAIWMGDCSDCLRPLDYIPLKVPDHLTIMWSETPGQVDASNNFYCFQCYASAVRVYMQACAQGLKIQGSPIRLDKGGT